MTSDSSRTITTAFYAPDVYDEGIDFTVVEDNVPLPSLGRALQSAVEKIITCVARVALLGNVTLNVPSAAQSTVSPGSYQATATAEREDIRGMTDRMLSRAGLASRLFRRTPHPGRAESDPDYGL